MKELNDLAAEIESAVDIIL